MSTERNTDKVALIMGDMLLKGYRMLASSCEVCNTVLMQDKGGINSCANCVFVAKGCDGTPLTIKLEGNTGDSLDRNHHSTAGRHQIILSSINVLLQEIESKTVSLIESANHEEQIKLTCVKYIRECAETIKALQDMQSM